MSELPALLPGGRELSDQYKRKELLNLVIGSVSSEHSKRAYRTGLEQFFLWWSTEARDVAFSRALVQRYRSGLQAQDKSASTINQRLAPVRKLAEEAAAAGLLSLETAGAIRQLKGAKQSGHRTGNWLLPSQAESLLSAPNRGTMQGKRDYALLSLLLCAGLRRDELARLCVEHIQQRDGRWCLVNLAGKGNHFRTIAIPDWVKTAVDEWLGASPISSGPLLGKINKGGRFVGQGMSAAAIYGLVLGYAEKLSINLKPHDLRRTYGKLAHQGGSPIEQIQLSYGHRSLTTTERYLGVHKKAGSQAACGTPT